jgi:hypothetical protein
MTRCTHDHHAVVRKNLDRERKRLVKDREERMKGDRRTQHVLNGIAKRIKKGLGA